MDNSSDSKVQAGQSTSSQGTTPVTVGSLAPANRPMQQAAPATSPAKKRKTGLIVGIIIAAVVLIGGGIAAALILTNLNKQNPVVAAIGKLMNEGAPENVMIDGNIEIATEDQSAVVSKIKIDLKSGLRPKSLINSSTATVTATVRNLGDLTVDVSEIYASEDSLFFKIDGATNAIEDSGILFLLNMYNNTPEVVDCGVEGGCQSDSAASTKCADGETCDAAGMIDLETLAENSQIVLDEDTAAFFASIIDTVELIDGEWLRISTDDIGAAIGGALTQSDAGCVVNLISSLRANSNSATELYSKYPFVYATNKNIPIESKQYPVYKVDINTENFTGYMNSARSAAWSEQIYSCLNIEPDTQIDENDAASMLEDLPEIYVEVDGDNNFTRLYANLKIDSGKSTIDLNFSYPTNINVTEPLEYQDFSEVIQDVSTSVYDADIDN